MGRHKGKKLVKHSKAPPAPKWADRDSGRSETRAQLAGALRPAFKDERLAKKVAGLIFERLGEEKSRDIIGNPESALKILQGNPQVLDGIDRKEVFRELGRYCRAGKGDKEKIRKALGAVRRVTLTPMKSVKLQKQLREGGFVFKNSGRGGQIAIYFEGEVVRDGGRPVTILQGSLNAGLVKQVVNRCEKYLESRL